MGWLRLLTQKKVMNACGLPAFSNNDAIELFSTVLIDEAVAQIEDTPGTHSLWLPLARNERASTKPWMAAYLAALALTRELERGIFNRGFERYRKSGLQLLLLRDCKERP